MFLLAACLVDFIGIQNQKWATFLKGTLLTKRLKETLLESKLLLRTSIAESVT